MWESVQLPTYPSPNLTLALTHHQLTPAGLGEGWVSSCSGIDFHANVAVICMMIVSRNEYSFLPQFTHLHKFIELSGCLPNVMFGFCYVFIKNLLSTYPIHFAPLLESLFSSPFFVCLLQARKNSDKRSPSPSKRHSISTLYSPTSSTTWKNNKSPSHR